MTPNGFRFQADHGDVPIRIMAKVCRYCAGKVETDECPIPGLPAHYVCAGEKCNEEHGAECFDPYNSTYEDCES